jgi:transcriptional regulator with XRE-family HTH domain
MNTFDSKYRSKLYDYQNLSISRHFYQDQLAQMSKLNVRTIQHIESGHNASIESLKFTVIALDVDISTLNQKTL